MKFTNLRFILIYLFIFLGPLGNIFCSGFIPYPGRIFHIILPLFFLFYTKLYFQEFKTLFIYLPFLFYTTISSYFRINIPAYDDDAWMNETGRCLLLVCESLFVFGAAAYYRNQASAKEKNHLIRLYLHGFFISLFIGYILFFGYYMQLFSFSQVQRFTIISQFSLNNNILRFSPGSYPNEYGITASFVASILLLLIAEKNQTHFQIGFSKHWLYCLFFLTFCALLLTTTRAAYCSFCLSILYLLFISRPFRKIFYIALFLTIFYFFLFQKARITVFKIFTFLFIELTKLDSGSINIRLNAWKHSFQQFKEHFFLGTGFGSFHSIHNVYLEFLAELGLIGSLTLIFFGLVYFINHKKKIKKIFFRRLASSEDLFSNRVIVLGLIHVFWFAATNHNINHHLTWMIFLLFNINLFAKKTTDKTLDTAVEQTS